MNINWIFDFIWETNFISKKQGKYKGTWKNLCVYFHLVFYLLAFALLCFPFCSSFFFSFFSIVLAFYVRKCLIIDAIFIFHSYFYSFVLFLNAYFCSEMKILATLSIFFMPFTMISYFLKPVSTWLLISYAHNMHCSAYNVEFKCFFFNSFHLRLSFSCRLYAHAHIHIFVSLWYFSNTSTVHCKNVCQWPRHAVDCIKCIHTKSFYSFIASNIYRRNHT